MLYEMITGEAVFRGATVAAAMSRHRLEQPSSIRIVRPAAAPALDAIVMKALAKAPDDRFPSAATLGEALERGR